MRTPVAVALLCVLAALHPTAALYSSTSKVVQLTDKDFKQVLKGDELWLVEFYAPWCGHCKSLAPEWDKAASTLAGVVKVAAVDATQSEKLASQYGIQGFPTIKVFGANKGKPADYQGQRTSAAIVDFALKEVNSLVKSRSGGGSRSTKSDSGSDSGAKGKGKHSGGGSGSGSGSGSDPVITLTDDNFDDLVLNSKDTWFVEFYAPWCGHCKKLAPEWAEAASQLQGSVKLGALDATAHTSVASRFNIRGYPTIKIFPGGSTKTDASAQDYNGPREAGPIVDAALKVAEASGGGAPTADVTQLTSQAVFDEICTGKRICVIAFLQNILDEGKAGRNKHLETLRAVAGKQRGRPFRFLWVESGAQARLEKDLGPFDAPAVVAVNVDKKKFVVHHGSMSAESIGSFCEGIMIGKGASFDLKSIPSIVSTTEWDGKDGKLDAVDEFSLDDIMGE